MAMPLDCASDVIYQVDADLEAGANRVFNNKMKRAMDIAGAGIGLLMLAPFLLLVALVIRLESSGPALFRQRRSGLNGVPFVIYKFRTMTVQEDGPNIVQASRDDCRLTRIGAFLRRSSIDELPNLINVLRGEMSVVGPRPHALAHDNHYSALIPNYYERYMTKPGLTGLAQVEGLRGQTETLNSMSDRVDRDIEYIRRWSIVLDVQLVIRTLMMGVFHPAAH
jgi:putative colanic acid biosynthesis UDP-glucose lipid carrier transferase